MLSNHFPKVQYRAITSPAGTSRESSSYANLKKKVQFVLPFGPGQVYWETRDYVGGHPRGYLFPNTFAQASFNRSIGWTILEFWAKSHHKLIGTGRPLCLPRTPLKVIGLAAVGCCSPHRLKFYSICGHCWISGSLEWAFDFQTRFDNTVYQTDID